ncbi:UNVERIFIED_CONTAM: DEAD-box ATP-dependent RNA helicase 3, chloroplastic [Sesamum radiatum]|uniref:DEAD-box ATP-dependent RNA helicase 3, chloroplastic n=1 Tax=Sesamum radiatum TaxID=300843 RepID=A0AAW2JEM1_SESRA
MGLFSLGYVENPKIDILSSSNHIQTLEAPTLKPLLNNSLKLGEVQCLVLDEADRTIAAGFVEDVEVNVEKLRSERQSILFSATMPVGLKFSLGNSPSKSFFIKQVSLNCRMLWISLLISYTEIMVGAEEEKLAEGISCMQFHLQQHPNGTILWDLVTVYAKGGKTIGFTQTKWDAGEVWLALTNSIASEALHGDISHHQRGLTLNGFRQGNLEFLCH